jgi:hypothetical protein
VHGLLAPQPDPRVGVDEGVDVRAQVGEEQPLGGRRARDGRSGRGRRAQRAAELGRPGGQPGARAQQRPHGALKHRPLAVDELDLDLAPGLWLAGTARVGRDDVVVDDLGQHDVLRANQVPHVPPRDELHHGHELRATAPRAHERDEVLRHRARGAAVLAPHLEPRVGERQLEVPPRVRATRAAPQGRTRPEQPVVGRVEVRGDESDLALVADLRHALDAREVGHRPVLRHVELELALHRRRRHAHSSARCSPDHRG